MQLSSFSAVTAALTITQVTSCTSVTSQPFGALLYQVANQFLTSTMYQPPMMMPPRVNTVALQLQYNQPK